MKIQRSLSVRGGVRLHAQQWHGDGVPFLLLHGLASNCRMWEMVAERLAARGHPVLALDQRGHGRSDKPPGGYDFASIAGDVAEVLDHLGWQRPLLVGQSWGANVALEFGVRYPGRVRGLGFVDGGFIDLRSHPAGTWEAVAGDLLPPGVRGLSPHTLADRIRAEHPGWSAAAVELFLSNYQVLADGTVRPWLSLDRHRQILRALWNQRPRQLYAALQEPVVLCVAGNGLAAAAHHRAEILAAQRDIRRVSTHTFPDSPHDIHLQHPEPLVFTFLQELRRGVWAHTRSDAHRPANGSEAHRFEREAEARAE